MPFTANTSAKSHFESDYDEDPNREQDLDALCQSVLRYARQAKVQRFRYCRHPHRPSSLHASLPEAIQALSEQLANAGSKPICQTQAIDFLRELAALGHQPPCQRPAQQKAAAFKINSALLELR